MGLISYTGRLVVRQGEKIDLKRTAQGLLILGPVTIVEQHQERKDRVKRNPAQKKFLEQPRAHSAADDDYIDVEPSWHRLTIFGDKAEELALNPGFNKGALVTVLNASYSEEAPWTMKDGSIRAGRPETMGDNNPKLQKVQYPASISFVFEAEAKDGEPPLQPIWDGESSLPAPGGGGGRGGQWSSGELSADEQSGF